MRSIAVCVVLAAACTSKDSESPLGGARLGMSLRDVRERFAPPGSNDSAWKVENDPEPKMIYTGVSGPVRRADFEFHAGMLVAATVLLDAHGPGAKGAPFSVTDGAVLARSPRGALSTVRIIARDCPQHQDEIREILSAAAK